jgi:hypothetical protein
MRNEASDPGRATTSIEGVSRTSAAQAGDSAIARSACSITAVTEAVVGAIGMQRSAREMTVVKTASWRDASGFEQCQASSFSTRTFLCAG